MSECSLMALFAEKKYTLFWCVCAGGGGGGGGVRYMCDLKYLCFKLSRFVCFWTHIFLSFKL